MEIMPDQSKISCSDSQEDAKTQGNAGAKIFPFSMPRVAKNEEESDKNTRSSQRSSSQEEK